MSRRLLKLSPSRRTPPSVRRRARERSRPQFDHLEDRKLQRVTSFEATVSPGLLSPTGRTVPVVVKGHFTIDNPQTPELRFQVVDEYRQVQPARKIAVLKTNETGGYAFTFPVNLQASAVSSDPSGRFYYITIAAKTPQGSSGKVVPVLVSPQPVPNAANALAIQGRGRLPRTR